MGLKNNLYLFFILWSFLCSAQEKKNPYQLNPLGLGGGLSIGVSSLQGQLGKQFSPYNIGGEMTGELIYKKWIANVGLKLIYARNTKQITYQNTVFDKKEIVFETVLKSLIGYDVLKNKNWRLMPFTGFGYGNIFADDPIKNPAPTKDFAYLNSGIIIDKFIGKFNFKNSDSIIFFTYHGVPSASWRFKAEYLHPFLINEYTQFNGNIFQVTFGIMLYLHGQNRFIVKEKN